MNFRHYICGFLNLKFAFSIIIILIRRNLDSRNKFEIWFRSIRNLNNMEDNFYLSLKNQLEKKLINELSKDEEFKDLNIQDLIKERVKLKLNEDIDFDKCGQCHQEPHSDYLKYCMAVNKKIKYLDENPKNPGSISYERYEQYKVATNYLDFIRLGGKNADYYYDYRKEYFKILD